jgi:hypothetical protein
MRIDFVQGMSSAMTLAAVLLADTGARTWQYLGAVAAWQSGAGYRLVQQPGLVCVSGL